MSIPDFINRITVQTAVYWETDGNDGYGGKKYLDPVEIDCRWDSHTEVMKDNDGVEFVSSAQILINRDLKERSQLYLGTLDSLPVDPDPLDIEDAFELRKMDRHPLFESSTLDVFIAYL